MVNRELAQKILEEAIGYSQSDEILVTLSGGKRSVTRFANNEIHQNVMKKDYVVKALVVRGGKVGFASCNLFEGDELARIVKNAEELAGHQPVDTHLVPMPGEATYRPLEGAYDKPTSKLSADEKARSVSEVTRAAGSEGLTVAGAYSTGDSCVALMNSNGCFAYHAHTAASFTLTVMTDEGAAGWAGTYGRRADELNPAGLYETARDKALLARNPVEIEPGTYTTILEPAAVKSLVGFLAWVGLGGQSLNEGRSCLTGRFGEKVTGSNITIMDDAFHPLTLGLPFDSEGTPRQTVALIDGGVAKTAVHDRHTAEQAGCESTGHALPYPSRYGPLPLNLRLVEGTSSTEEMVAQTERGILVSRFWYDNLVDPRVPILTGMTRDGTYLIEDGKVTGALLNLRYNESILSALGRVSAAGRKLQSFAQPGPLGARLACPSLKIEDFNFTGCSRETDD